MSSSYIPYVFKVKVAQTDAVPQLYVFCDNKTGEELQLRHADMKNAIITNTYIYPDDTIETIKLKIYDALKQQSGIIMSIDEMYLYCKVRTNLNPEIIFQQITQNNTKPLTRQLLYPFIANLYTTEKGEMFDISTFDEYPVDEIFTFDNILGMDLERNEYLVGTPVGQKFVRKHSYFIADPMSMTDPLTGLKPTHYADAVADNSTLLLDIMPFFENTLYLCSAQTVLKSYPNSTSEYFPSLFALGIHTWEHLHQHQSELVSRSESLLHHQTASLNAIHNLNQLYNDGKSSTRGAMPFNDTTGIQNFKIVYKPVLGRKLPF